MFEVGSYVKIVQPTCVSGLTYIVFGHVSDARLRGSWDYFGVPPKGTKGVVRAVKGRLCYVEADTGKCYLMWDKGLKEIDSCNY